MYKKVTSFYVGLKSTKTDKNALNTPFLIKFSTSLPETRRSRAMQNIQKHSKMNLDMINLAYKCLTITTNAQVEFRN